MVTPRYLVSDTLCSCCPFMLYGIYTAVLFWYLDITCNVKHLLVLNCMHQVSAQELRVFRSCWSSRWSSSVSMVWYSNASSANRRMLQLTIQEL